METWPRPSREGALLGSLPRPPLRNPALANPHLPAKAREAMEGEIWTPPGMLDAALRFTTIAE